MKHPLICLAVTLMAVTFVPALPSWAMKFKTENAGEIDITGAVKASFGGTQYLDFTDDHDKGDDADFDATRELKLQTKWILNENLEGVASFQIGEGSTGGYFGSTDATVGGEEDGDLIFELDNLYIDYTTDSKLNFKIGSQGFNFGELAYGSHLMNEVPAGVTLSTPVSESVSVRAGWFRIADLMDDSSANTDDQADLLFAKLPMDMGNHRFSPWLACARIQEDVVKNAPSHWTYAYFDYPGLLSGANSSIGSPLPTDDVTVYYLGMSADFSPTEALLVKAGITYGEMDWETADVDVTIAGFFADFVVNYKMAGFTPEFFALYGSGPDRDDSTLDMMPTLIGGPTYTSSYFGGSRFNDNMFDSHDSTYATAMWGIGFKIKDLKTTERLTHEFQIMYGQGTADEGIFESPDDILLNEDESILELNFNSEYQITRNLVFATELGYIVFDQDSDYNEATQGPVKDLWKMAFAVELTF